MNADKYKVLGWLPGLAGGQALYSEFMSKVWEPTTDGVSISRRPGRGIFSAPRQTLCNDRKVD